ncbi:MAG: lysophospholipid acyltransferase family protein [Bacteroidales bacterium]|nr:lysophospholipid acyltransferase family protein [Bacteroidales bacterium]
MKAILFRIFFAVNWVITLLPLRILYIFAWLFFLVLAFPGYRRQVIIRNLRNAFPEKSKKELKRIRRRYWFHFAHLVIESLKLQHMSGKELKKRYRIKNPEILNRLHDEGRSALAVFGHYGNWEWIVIAQQFTRSKFIAIYKPLKNPWFDSYLLKLRRKYGTSIVPMSHTLREIAGDVREGIPSVTALLSDQTPPRREIRYWTRFLNQDTPVYLGIEKLSRKMNMPVLWFNIEMERRGYYTINIEVLTDSPQTLDEHVITEMHVRKLEEQIVRRPELWLWSHRRWKHKKPAVND